MGSRSIGPRRLYGLNQVARNNLNNIQDGTKTKSNVRGLVESVHMYEKDVVESVVEIAQAMEVNDAATPTPREVQNNHINDEEEQGNTEGKGSKLKFEIPDEIDRAIGENARHLVNESGCIVRTRAPFNVKNWQEAFSVVGDSMWKEIQIVSERNSKNRFSDKRVIHTTGNLAFAEVEDILSKENDNVKPSADVVWLIEHTRKNKEGELEWADATRSKTIHDKLKHVVAEVGDTMTQEEILI
ncbi:Angiopoietin-1 receptor [Bienertia sinuspersici]